MNPNTVTHGRAGESAIDAKGLVKRFKTGRSFIEVLKGVDFDARHGEMTMVMGPSGSGKSTLVAALSGLLKPEEGRVDALDVDDLWDHSSGRIDKFRLDNCGFIFQGFNLFPALTATQQVMTVLKYQGVAKDEARRRAVAALEEVGLGARLNQKPPRPRAPSADPRRIRSRRDRLGLGDRCRRAPCLSVRQGASLARRPGRGDSRATA